MQSLRTRHCAVGHVAAQVYEVEFPEDVMWLLRLFSVGLSFGLSDVSTVLACVGLQGYVHVLTAYMVVPMILASAVVLFASIWLRLSFKLNSVTLMETAVPALLRLSFIAYPVRL